ncbi:MAG: crossover junction endodeoxyribonuclease RuvC [Actinobacteria bacterium]|nr:crossover junction endodeoxyribonuclease RuvC [Actinomycetota bacterium]MCG2818711.1 crossover junction endodeoxyribonuclease RuvC [Actinomycetes bacterium]MBU4218607.1 crossover junction endodeoxyribonuclease RuvC [Actinomycetota bacterium]MBU4359871.1 crossover junction endodeoxyribonuclease RuvC [Actinomycetota bacterium]MBU4391136.1 crossover junction endodeoxyribonuclease RuvC [Actinomycetota bacterium]
MKALGIDPGITNTGFGMVVEESGRMSAGDFGSIKTRSGGDMSDRLDTLYREVMRVIRELEPDVAVIEQLFFNTNLKTAVSVGQARGVILLACRHAEVDWAEYTPLQVKKAVVGNGNAGKEQVRYMVGALLGMKSPPSPLHASDALAMAICHLQSRRLRELTGS